MEFPENATRKCLNGHARNDLQLISQWPDYTHLRCVNAKEAEHLMEEIHEGSCGPHMNVQDLGTLGSP